MRLKLEKYHGLGNDYLVFDPEHNGMELTPERVKLLCNRNLGVGADGILEGPVFKEGKIHMIIWNSDGSQTENSGNGIRIFAKYLKDADYVQKKDITIYTDEKEIEIHYLNEEGTRLKASMGKASFWSDEVPVEGPRREIINETMVFGHIPYPVTCISVGNPHLVILMDEISKDLVCRIGKYSETAKQFPERSIPRSSRCWTALIYRQKFMKEVQVIHWHPEAAAVQQLRQLTDWDLQIRK